MRKLLSYEGVIDLLTKSESDDFIQQVTTLLNFAHEVMKNNDLKKEDFDFTLFDEGHILITNIKKTIRI